MSEVQILSWIICVITAIQIWLYGQAKRPKLYKTAPITGIISSTIWIIYSYLLGKDGEGILVVSIIILIIHIYNMLTISLNIDLSIKNFRKIYGKLSNLRE